MASLLCADHMRQFLNPSTLSTKTKQAVKALALRDFDSVAFRGMSGAMIAPPVAVAMRKGMILVRKRKNESHSNHKVEGNNEARRYVILDDFVSTGFTRNKIREAIKVFAPEAAYVGLLSVLNIDSKILKYCAEHNIPYPLDDEDDLLMELTERMERTNDEVRVWTTG